MTSSPSKTSRLAAFVFGNSVLLPAGAIIALVWANLADDSYVAFADFMHFAVNDVGMTLFFALASKEIVEATAAGGALHPPKKAVGPVAGALGGMLLPAAIFLALTTLLGQTSLAAGWAIPTATDIAFSFLIARWLFGPQHPAVPFLLLLAIADDALGLVALAIVYPAGRVRPLAFVVLLAIALGICWMLRRRRVMQVWPYVVVGGVVSWAAFFNGGVHPALALVPVMPFLPHAPRATQLFEERRDAARDPLTRFEHAMRVPVELVLFLFGLVNAGVPLGRVGPGTWIVLASLLIGKPIGISAAVAMGRALGAPLPAGIRARDVLVVGTVAGIGFTVALFFCTAALREGPMLDQAKMGALLSFAAAPVACATAAALGVGRFRRTSIE